MNFASLIRANRPSAIPSAAPAPAAVPSRAEALGEVLPAAGGFRAPMPKNMSIAADTQRIMDVPIRVPCSDAELEEFSRNNLLASAYARGERFKPSQGRAIKEFHEYMAGDIGGMHPIGVGNGKTLACYAMHDHAYKNGVRKSMQLCPSHLVHQLVGRDLRWARTMIPFGTPVHNMHGLSPSARMLLAKSGKSGIYVFPYSLLSTKDASELLDAIAPELLICDEAHMLANHTAARTRRLFWYVTAKRPKGVCLSGTLTSKSVVDYHHLMSWTMRESSPLPLSRSLAEEWGTVIDAKATVGGASTNSAAFASMRPLAQWARENFPDEDMSGHATEAFRKAYRLRLTHTRGIVSSDSETLGTSLTLCNVPVEEKGKREGWDKLATLIGNVKTAWITPNGDELEHAIHIFKWLYELSAGFYNELTWPETDEYANRKQLSRQDASDHLELAKDHHAAGQAYHKALRDFLSWNTDTAVDTPMKAGQSMHLHGARHVPGQLHHLWQQYHAADFEGRPDRDAKAIRVCDYKVNDILKWAQQLPKGEGALIWCHHLEMAAWVYEVLHAAGLNAVLRPSDEEVENPDNNHKIMILTVRKYCEGKNLQHFVHQYVAQWPRQARTAEQMLGRCHRTGQKADELFVTMNNTLEVDDLNFAACLNDSAYIAQTMGTPQKLMYCGYSPDPKIFPAVVLRERGLEAKIIDPSILIGRFGQ